MKLKCLSKMRFILASSSSVGLRIEQRINMQTILDKVEVVLVDYNNDEDEISMTDGTRHSYIAKPQLRFRKSKA
jgi:hypothetical protein